MKILLALLLLFPSLSWGSIKLVCQGHSMVQIGYPENSGQTYLEAKYLEKPTVNIIENEDMIFVKGVSDGVMAYAIQTWRNDEDAFYGEAIDFEGVVGQIYINRISGEMIRMTYLPNKEDKKTLLEFYYDCNKASKKF